MCKGALGGGLSAVSRRDCETSGFIAAPAPTGDYGIDVHIDTGVVGFNAASAVQDLFVTPLWTALVWAVHALVVMLEWCYTIDLLDSASVSVGAGLRRMQSSLTGPWLATVLAVAAVIAAYNGLVRRRVAETVGQALMTLAMMAGGMWVILDPTGTVGVLGEWANQTSLGTLAVTARGTPAAAGQALADSMRIGVRGGDRSAVVLFGVRRCRLVPGPRAAGSAAARGRVEDRRRRAAPGRLVGRRAGPCAGAQRGAAARR